MKNPPYATQSSLIGQAGHVHIVIGHHFVIKWNIFLWSGLESTLKNVEWMWKSYPLLMTTTIKKSNVLKSNVVRNIVSDNHTVKNGFISFIYSFICFIYTKKLDLGSTAFRQRTIFLPSFDLSGPKLSLIFTDPYN